MPELDEGEWPVAWGAPPKRGADLQQLSFRPRLPTPIRCTAPLAWPRSRVAPGGAHHGHDSLPSTPRPATSGPLSTDQPYYRAYTLESLDLDEAALKELKEAMRADPFYADVHSLIGKIYSKKKDYQKAFEHFRIADMASPGEKEIRQNLALSYFDLGRYEGASRLYKGIIQTSPKDPKAYFLLTKTYVAMKQYTQAVDTLKKAHQLSPEDAKDPIELGDKMFDQNAYAEAQQAYDMALETNKHLDEIYKKKGFLFLAINKEQQAKQAFEKALTYKPDDEEIKKALQDLN